MQELLEDIRNLIFKKLPKGALFELGFTSKSMRKIILDYLKQDYINKKQDEINKSLQTKNIGQVEYALHVGSLSLFQYYETLGIVPKIIHNPGKSIELIKYLIKNGYEISVWSLLHIIQYNDLDIFNLLIDSFINELPNYHPVNISLNSNYRKYELGQSIVASLKKNVNVLTIKTKPGKYLIYKSLCKYGNLPIIQMYKTYNLWNLDKDFIKYMSFYDRIDIFKLYYIDKIEEYQLILNYAAIDLSKNIIKWFVKNNVELIMDISVLKILASLKKIKRFKQILDLGYTIHPSSCKDELQIISIEPKFIPIMSEHGYKFNETTIRYASEAGYM